MLGGEALRAVADEVHVRAFAEDFPRGANGIAKVLDAADTTAPQGGAVHDEGIELHPAVAVEEAAAAGVEGLVVFHDDDGCLDRIERGAAALEYAPAGGGGVAHAVQVRLDHVVGNCPRPAVDD